MLWLVAGSITVFFAIPSFSSVYLFIMLSMIAIAIGMDYLHKSYHCEKCGSNYSEHQLRQKI